MTTHSCQLNGHRNWNNTGDVTGRLVRMLIVEEMMVKEKEICSSRLDFTAKDPIAMDAFCKPIEK
uniref:Uncharacterized protein n=1 Tax=Magallana gigas TaxID=29159 RepID=K1PZG5_MAGGI